MAHSEELSPELQSQIASDNAWAHLGEYSAKFYEKPFRLVESEGNVIRVTYFEQNASEGTQEETTLNTVIDQSEGENN